MYLAIWEYRMKDAPASLGSLKVILWGNEIDWLNSEPLAMAVSNSATQFKNKSNIQYKIA